jgi:hypothetical protein
MDQGLARQDLAALGLGLFAFSAERLAQFDAKRAKVSEVPSGMPWCVMTAGGAAGTQRIIWRLRRAVPPLASTWFAQGRTAGRLRLPWLPRAC